MLGMMTHERRSQQQPGVARPGGPPVGAPEELLDRIADESLLTQPSANLPAGIDVPPTLTAGKARGRVVAVGATLTGASLIGGLALTVLAVVMAISGSGEAWEIALVVGVLLVATHWGWVHVAEATANALDARLQQDEISRRQQWLRDIGPYTRSEITTAVGDDGSIAINRVRYRPVAAGPGRFVFAREATELEIHGADQPSAGVAERAEVLRRQAALETDRERARYEEAASEHAAAIAAHTDEENQQAAQRAVSQALSEQINTNLREPPLQE